MYKGGKKLKTYLYRVFIRISEYVTAQWQNGAIAQRLNEVEVEVEVET